MGVNMTDKELNSLVIKPNKQFMDNVIKCLRHDLKYYRERNLQPKNIIVGWEALKALWFTAVKDRDHDYRHPPGKYDGIPIVYVRGLVSPVTVKVVASVTQEVEKKLEQLGSLGEKG